MRQMQYLRPTSLPETLELLGTWGERAKILAGGTDLLIAIRRKIKEPEAIIDISLLKELDGICRQDGYIQIGALTTHSHICQSTQIAECAPLLAQACRGVGSLQIRNRGTLGGNLGNASPAGDTIPPLYTLESEVRLLSSSGERWVPVNAFFTAPGKTVKRLDELIAGVRFRPLEKSVKCFTKKIGQRRAVTIAKVSAAGVLFFEGKLVHDCRIALGAVAPTVIRLPAAEKTLLGKPLTPERIDEAATLASELCSPITDIRSNVEYRCTMTRVLVSRGLKSILEEMAS